VKCFGPLLSTRGLVCASCREQDLQLLTNSYRKTVTVTPSEEFL
jgi:hypothetical protein